MAIITRICRYCESSDCICERKFREDSAYARRVIERRLVGNRGVDCIRRVAEMEKLREFLADRILEVKSERKK